MRPGAHHIAATAAGLLVTYLAVGISTCSAVTLYLPGSTLPIGVTLPIDSYYDVEVDPSGNVCLASGSAGVLKVTPQGAISTWSSVQVANFAFAPDGTAYAAGRTVCNCLDVIATNGTSSILRQDTHEWDYVALTPDGTLYADVIAGDGGGLYRVDRTTGGLTPIVIGGPGPGGAGSFGHLSAGVDGKLFANGSPDGATRVVYRLDGNSLTPVNLPPYGYGVLVAGPGGLDVANEANSPQSELWLVNLGAGSSNLLAKADYGALHAPPPVFSAIAYDPGAGLVYAVQDNMLWGIHPDLSTPAQSETWGAVKALYHK